MDSREEREALARQFLPHLAVYHIQRYREAISAAELVELTRELEAEIARLGWQFVMLPRDDEERITGHYTFELRPLPTDGQGANHD